MDAQPLATAELIGRTVQGLRDTIGLGVDALARRCDLDAQTIADLEAGRIDPSLDVLLAVARGLDVSLTMLCRLSEHGGVQPRSP